MWASKSWLLSPHSGRDHADPVARAAPLAAVRFWLTAVSSAALMPTSCARSGCMLPARAGAGSAQPRDVCAAVSRSAGTGVPSTSTPSFQRLLPADGAGAEPGGAVEGPRTRSSHVGAPPLAAVRLVVMAPFRLRERSPSGRRARTGKGRSMGCGRAVQGAVTRLTVVALSSGGVRRTSALGHSQRSSSTSPCEVHADGLRRRPLRSLGRGESGHAIDTRTLQLVGPASRPRSRADQPRLVSEDHGLDAAAELEFAEDAADVGLDRALLQEELGGDLGVALALGDQE